MKNDLSEINWQAMKGPNLSAMGEAHRPGLALIFIIIIIFENLA